MYLLGFDLHSIKLVWVSWNNTFYGFVLQVSGEVHQQSSFLTCLFFLSRRRGDFLLIISLMHVNRQVVEQRISFHHICNGNR